jgi:hypothetical protein
VSRYAGCLATQGWTLVHRALCRYVPSRINRGVLEESRPRASKERALTWLTIRFSAREADVLQERKLNTRCTLDLSI